MQLSTRQRLGRYYTPGWLAEELVKWALPKTGSLLDPSFGGCAFLEAALKYLKGKSVRRAGELIHGVDVDRHALKYAESLFQGGVPRSNILIDDFMTERVFAGLARYDAVVGNPPYIRHHRLSDAVIENAQRAIAPFAAISKRSSGWAYFAVLAAELVRDGGRMAFILPGAVLHSDYGSQVSKKLSERFQCVTMLHIPERLFDGTDEESVIVLAENRVSRGSGEVRYERLGAAKNIGIYLAKVPKTDAYRSDDFSYKRSLISAEAEESWSRIRTAIGAVALGDVARVRIGVVTGANDFFVRESGDPILNLKDVQVRNIIAHRKHLHIPDFNRNAMRAIERSGEACKLAIIKGKGRAGSGLSRELASACEERIPLRHHCSKRDPWYTVPDLDVPDILLPYLNGSAPHLIKNSARALCTNTIHRVDLEEAESIESIVTSSYGVLFAFECEVFGRHYGGSVLKIEPSGAKKLSVSTNLNLLDDLSHLDSEARRHDYVNRTFERRFSVKKTDVRVLAKAVALLKQHRQVARVEAD